MSTLVRYFPRGPRFSSILTMTGSRRVVVTGDPRWTSLDDLLDGASASDSKTDIHFIEEAQIR
jgi:hypothetical protein